MKPENKSTQAFSAQVHDWAAENRQLRKELLSREKRIEELEAMASSLNKQLSEKIDQINDMVQKLMAFMTGDGGVNLSEYLRQSIVAEVSAEFEAREQKLKVAYAHEREELDSDFKARLAATQNELNQLKGINAEDDLKNISENKTK
uniref:CT620/CT621 family type III secretion system effector n=1 Tax=Prevotella sp. TaxID=59823 RepID=UPI003FEF986F